MKNVLKKIYHSFLQCIPNGHQFDHFVAFIDFLRLHKRLPSNKLHFNDVLYKIKTTDEIIDPLRVFVSDKEFVKLFVKAVVGDQFNVPTIKILHTMEEARSYLFPSDCCIKPTHMSGKVILRKQNSSIDFEEMDRWLMKSHYNRIDREANYKTLKPKIIIEPLIFDSDNLSDYKIFCYMGKPKLVQVDIDRQIGHTRKIFDLNWNEMPFSLCYPKSSRQIEKPKNLDNMLAVANSLSSYFNFVRIDFYSDGKDCFVGEITNCHGGATENFLPKSGEIMASEMIFGRN